MCVVTEVRKSTKDNNMTTTAYRDGVLAVDRIMTHGYNYEETDTKLRLIHNFQRVKGDYAAIVVSGDLANAYTFMDWFEAEYPKGKKIEFAHDIEEHRFKAITVNRLDDAELIVNYWDSSMYPFVITDLPYSAYGVGDDLALGAMHHGATAIEAVEAANHHCMYSGFGVLSIDFNTVDPIVKRSGE